MTFSALLIGHESLTIQCGTMLLEAGQTITAVVTEDKEVSSWAREAKLDVIAPGTSLGDRMQGRHFDWIVSAANLTLIPDAVLNQASKGAVNFHDGPLPAYAGLNAPVWTILNGEAEHGVTWHMIEGGIDEGDIIAQRMFGISDSETALTLNTKCYAAGIESFTDVMAALAQDVAQRQVQDLSKRSYFGRDARPKYAAVLDFTQPTDAILRNIRALDHGNYANPIAIPKIIVSGEVVLVRVGSAIESNAPAGTLLGATGDSLRVATSDGGVELSGLSLADGSEFDPRQRCQKGTVFSVDEYTAEVLYEAAAKSEPKLRKALQNLVPAVLYLPGEGGGVETIALPKGKKASDVYLAMAHICQSLNDEEGPVDLALHVPNDGFGLVSNWVPIRYDPMDPDKFLESMNAPTGFAIDLPVRIPGYQLAMPEVALSESGVVVGAAVTVCVGTETVVLHGQGDKIGSEGLGILANRLAHVLSDNQGLPASETELMLSKWNATDAEFDGSLCVHQMFEEQVAKTPDAIALVFEGETLTYAELNARANAVAHVLQAKGAKPGHLVGLSIRRSAHLLIGALAIQKAGAAYVPLDPAYPSDRLSMYIEDSGAEIILTESTLVDELPLGKARVVAIDTDATIASAPEGNLESGVTSDDLAYLIFTSGSTGRPKGVMVEHRNVANFFVGMDDRINHDETGTWLAVTSLSFDISVLELFWTLARGFKVVISGDENRALMSTSTTKVSAQKIDFSIYYWGNDDEAGQGKYHLLLEGAKFADEHGFCAVWTPERHFHAFGGPYPNPSVTGAAVAAVTKNIGVRAGSCVGPLHHPARIAEEWSVVDNLTNGRAGIAIASGWHPDDFILRPENSPPNNKPAMFEMIETLRKLWVGEAVEFPRADGEMHAVVTQPRPVSKKLPIWVTTAGNPETWREAGTVGANVLTHLLGQSLDEVGEKIKIYHQALRDAGRDPNDYSVTLMLHTFLAETREKSREIAREPMKDYLRSAAGLIKQYAWAFPAFKRPKGVKNAFELDLGSLEPDELEGILDFAFERYFNDSGLFGTVEDAIARVESLKAYGIAEVACLIDYGIPTDTVLAGLRPLAEALKRTNTETTVADDDFSIAAQITRHAVTHMQCTPSMARMLVTNDESRAALGQIKNLMIGGEPLPGALVADIKAATDAHVENMYGPTETTIWSTTQTATAGDGITGIGSPVANTQTYVLADDMQPLPIGMAGELWIGGAGVARGYWKREDLTAERFVKNPFGEGRIYRTGDLVRWRPDGTLDFLGRCDHQVKLRGYRIELGEIEAQLDLLPAVRQSVVIAREDAPGLTRLVGYVLTDTDVDETSLRGSLALALPEHMVPARIVRLDAFPLTPNKKIDRKALPAPKTRKTAQRVASLAPRQGSSASVIAKIWGDILGVSGAGDRDNFFDLGGHSLLAVQAHRDIKTALGCTDLSITDIFRYPTLGALAAKIDKGRAPAQSSAGQEAVAQERASNRSDAMSRRREMRARRSKSK